jgi:Holliday junction resolvasome RuvABC DNA-binding subunit
MIGTMIGKGTLDDKNPPQVIVDCHGVGYGFWCR